MNNLSYFPAVRIAMKKTTDELDRLMAEATQANDHVALKAYQKSFSLIREGLERVENQGESKFHIQVDEALQIVLKQATYINFQANRLKRMCTEGYDKACTQLSTDIISLLKEQGVSKQTLHDNTVDIYEAACYHVIDKFQEKGINLWD